MNLIDFILAAKLSGYANNGDGQRIQFDDGSIGFKFESNQFKYLDRYYGSNPFAGTEFINKDDGTLIWIMNYYGGVTAPDMSLDKTYSFLKEAMSLITPDYPFRGPEKFEKHSFSYKNNQQGTIDKFYGSENIFYHNKLVYTLHYHGGRLDNCT